MYELIHHCFGKCEVLSSFDNYPKPEQLLKVVPKNLQKGVDWTTKLLEKHTITLAVGEWLELNEVSHAD